MKYFFAIFCSFTLLVGEVGEPKFITLVFGKEPLLSDSKLSTFNPVLSASDTFDLGVGDTFFIFSNGLPPQIKGCFKIGNYGIVETTSVLRVRFVDERDTWSRQEFTVRPPIGGFIWITIHQYIPPWRSIRTIMICDLEINDNNPRNNERHYYWEDRWLWEWWRRPCWIGDYKKEKNTHLTIISEDTLFKIFALRGNILWEYDPWSNKFILKESVPGKRKVGTGACMTSDKECIYVIKGKNTKEVWRYNPKNGEWNLLPEPPFTKGIKGGFAAYTKINDTGYIYLGCGSNNNEFAKFNIITGQWEPHSLPVEKIKNGTAISSYKDSFLYLLVRGKRKETNKFFCLDLRAQNPIWQERKSLPINGRGEKDKKVKNAALISCGGTIYAVKGKGSYLLYQYFPLADSWDDGRRIGYNNYNMGSFNAYGEYRTLTTYSYRNMKWILTMGSYGDLCIFIEFEDERKANLPNSGLRKDFSPPHNTGYRYRQESKIYDISGRLVTSFHSSLHSVSNFQFPVSLKPGLYFIRSRNGLLTKIVIVK